MAPRWAARVKPEELYRLRRLQLEAERLALETQRAQREVKAFLLELERRYRLLGSGATLDSYTGDIREEGEP